MEKIIRDYSEESDGSLSPVDIKLGADGVTDIVMQSDFSGEMSFDEYSNLFGRKARARRQKRRIERIRNRQERRKLRRAGRREAMRERQEMRTERKQRRIARKKMGEEEEAPTEEASAPIEEGYVEESQYEEAPVEEYAPQDEYVDEETGESDEEAGYTGDYGFDGIRQPSQADVNFDDFYSADGGKMIDPRVQELAQRIEKVKTKINDKTNMLNMAQRKLSDPDFQKKRPARYVVLKKMAETLPISIARLQEMLTKLESALANRSKFDGDYSDADGSTLDSIAQKKAEVRQAKRLARKERKMALRSRRKARVKELMDKLRSQGMSGSQALLIARKQVEVEMPMLKGAELDAMDNVKPSSTSTDASINQDSTSSFDSMGLYGLDDNSPVNNMSSADGEFYSADGTTKKKTWMWVGIGVGVAVIGIIAYNMLRKK